MACDDSWEPTTALRYLGHPTRLVARPAVNEAVRVAAAASVDELSALESRRIEVPGWDAHIARAL